MNTKKIRILNEVIIQQLNHWMLYPLALAFWGALKEIDGSALDPRPFQWFLFSLFPLAYLGLRCRIKRLFPFLFLHLIVAVLPFLLPLQSSGTRVICIVCGVGYMLYSAVLRLKHDTIYSDALQLPLGIGFSIVSIFFLHYLDIKGWDNYYIFALIGSVVLFLLNAYLERYLYFIATNEGSAGVLPAEEMFYSGIGMVLGYSLLGALVLVLSSQVEWLLVFLNPIKNLLLSFLRFLVSLLPVSEPGEEIPIMEEQPQNPMGAMELPGETESFWLWDVLEYLVLTLFACAVIFALGALLFKLIQLIRRYLILHSNEKKEVDFGDAIDIREKCGVEKEKERRRQISFLILSPRERIRKLYKEKILSQAGNDTEKKSQLELHTAREWEQKIGTDGMAALYEQARYSPHEMTKEDVKKMRKSCKA